MKKIISALIILLVSTSLFAVTYNNEGGYSSRAALPDSIATLRVGGDYRQLKNSAGGITKTYNISIASDLDYYINDYIGFFGTVGVTIPLKGSYEGNSISWSGLDVPVFCKIGVLGRIPLNSNMGLELRVGIGENYTAQYSYWNYYSPYYASGWIIADETKVSKAETQVIAGVDFYTFLDRANSFGVRVGVDAQYTFFSYIEKKSSWTTSITDLDITGVEIQPYASLIFSF